MKKREISIIIILAFSIALALPAFESEGPAASVLNTDYRDNNNIEVEVSSFVRTASNYGSLVREKFVRYTDGSILHLEVGNNSFSAHLSDSSGRRIYDKSISYELPVFGGFHSGANFNFAVFGQNNPSESPSAEVFRIVKYDKDWNRKDALSLYGGTGTSFDSTDYGNTTEPFRASSLRFAENGDTLVFHTGRTMYTSSSDNLRHQASLYVFIDIPTMTVITGQSTPWVSHSFDQYPLFDNGVPVFLDHGDAYQRALTINRGSTRASMLSIPGTIGNNWTGVTVGGFEMSSQNYIAVANVTKDYAMANNTRRDIYSFVLPRNFTAGAVGTQNLIAAYYGTDRVGSVPKMVKVDEDSFAVIWQEFELNVSRSLGYVLQYIDGSGMPVGSFARYDTLYEMLSAVLQLDVRILLRQMPGYNSSSYALGDVTGDGDIDIADVNLLYLSVRGRVALSGAAIDAADVNGDGSIDIADVNLLYLYVRGRITQFP